MKKIFCLILGFGLLALSCKNSSSVNAPQVEDIQVDFPFVQFDQYLSNTSSENMSDSLFVWQEKYPNFIDLYLTNILALPTTEMSHDDIVKSLIDFNNHPGISAIQHSIDSLYSDMSSVQKEFHQAFQFFTYYFPDFSAPAIYTCNSEFGIQRFLFQTQESEAIGIGLDLFLGGSYPYRQYMPDNPAFSSYVTRSFNKDHIVKKSLEAILEDQIPFPNGGNLLDQMIFHGKKLYILDHLLPYHSDTIIMEYTEDQLNWCDDNQAEMWAYLLKEELFYSSDINKISKLVSPSPTSSGMPEESPGRTANYIGWKVVESFMEKNPEMTMSELILLDDAQKILEISRFKPKRK